MCIVSRLADRNGPPLAVKIKRFGKSLIQVTPEYEDCKRIAIEQGIPLQEVIRIIRSEAHKQQPSSYGLPDMS